MIYFIFILIFFMFVVVYFAYEDKWKIVWCIIGIELILSGLFSYISKTGVEGGWL